MHAWILHPAIQESRFDQIESQAATSSEPPPLQNPPNRNEVKIFMKLNMNFYTQLFPQDMPLHKEGSIDVVSTVDLKASTTICETLSILFWNSFIYMFRKFELEYVFWKWNEWPVPVYYEI